MNFYIKSLFVLFSLFFWGSFCYAYSSNTTTYWCDGGCGGEIVYQSCHSSQSSCCPSDSDDEEGEESTCEEGEMTTTCGAIIKTGVKAEPWQKCVGGSQAKGSWSYCGDSGDFSHGNKFYFVCSGDCLYNVSEVRYYDNPTYPKNPELTIDQSETYPETCSAEDSKDKKAEYGCIEPSESSSSVLLPLKIDWDEDASWLAPKTTVTQFVSDLSYFPVYENLSTLGAQSYKITLNNVTVDSFSEPTSSDKKEFSDYISKDFDKDTEEMDQGYFYKILNVDSQPSYIEGGNYRSSEYNFRVDHNPCWFKSGQDYSLKIQTCCNKDGTDCNSGGTFNFTTALAPELKSPEDLDWGGKGYSAWNAWAGLAEEDYILDVEERIYSLPNTKYNPFNWETTSIEAYNSEKVAFPIFLDWCDVDSVNGPEEEEKGSWNMKLFQVIVNDEDKKEEVLHPGLLTGVISIPSKPVHAGADWTDVLYSNYYDESNESFFTENEKYSWEIDSCLEEHGDCKGYGEHWSLETEDSDLVDDFKFLTRDGSTLGVPTRIEWVLSRKVNSVKYNVPGVIADITNQGGITLNNLELNKSYSITIIPCSDYDSLKCESGNAKSITFKTTGAPPIINNLGSEGVSIPVKISWSSVAGAMAYYYSLNGAETLNEGVYKTLYYPEVISNTSYSLKVKTCADEAGNNCGEYGEAMVFETEKLGVVESISTDDNDGILYTNDRNIQWDVPAGANYYKYALSYKGDDTSKTCQNLKSNIEESIISDPSLSIESLCSGNYNLSIKSCLDFECNVYGDVGIFSFALDSKKDPNEGSSSSFMSGGLVPCNRSYDDTSTAWDETLSCNISHIFLMVRLVFDFLLIRLLPALLILLLLYTGGFFLFFKIVFFDRSRIDVIQKMKGVWKAAGIGFLIIFLSWTVINLFLLFVDPEMSTFGSWWDPLN